MNCSMKLCSRLMHSYQNGIGESIPRITVPISMQNRIKKIKSKMIKKEEVKRIISQSGGNKNVPVISCKHKQFNHHLNEKYNKFKEVRLASRGWMHRKSYGDHFTINPFKSNPAVVNSKCWPSFHQIDNLEPKIASVLTDIGINHPTVIQKECLNEALGGSNLLCCGQTGSGKTLAYILPIFNHLLRYHATDIGEYHKSLSNCPLSLVLLPTRELAHQVYDVAHQIGTKLGFNIQLSVGGERTTKAIKNPEFEFGIDMLISTPGVLRKFTSSTLIKLNRICHLALDEVDTLLDDSFSQDTITILKRVNTSEKLQQNLTSNQVHGVQLYMIGATMPSTLKETITRVTEISKFKNVCPSNLTHQIMPHISQKFVRIRPIDKPAKLLYEVSKCFAKEQPIIIFTSNSKACHWMHMFLEKNRLANIALHGQISLKERSGRFESFVAGFSPILTCTDLASRGLDTTHVHHVFNYDFPSYMSDYIHRVGRVGRVGSKSSGSVLNLISKPWEIELVKRIEMACRTECALPDVNANIKRVLEQNHAEVEAV